MDNKDRISELLGICKEEQGEYIPFGHGPGSFATSYSYKFIDAAAELYVLLEQNGALLPIFALSKVFKDADILSCRGRMMSIDKVEYLYNNHLKQRIEKMKITKNV